MLETQNGPSKLLQSIIYILGALLYLVGDTGLEPVASSV